MCFERDLSLKVAYQLLEDVNLPRAANKMNIQVKDGEIIEVKLKDIRTQVNAFYKYSQVGYS